MDIEITTPNQPKITPFLWFNDNIDEALKIYSDIFEDFKIHNQTPWNPNMADKNGKSMSATIEFLGQKLIIFDGGSKFVFNPSVSFFINCKNQDDVDYYWNKFIDAGGTESRCGWLTDKFGLSWQIIPEILSKLLADKNSVKAQKAMQSMLTMNKINCNALIEAFNG